MNIYTDVEQWRIDLIQNPPKVSKMFSTEEWKHMVMNEFIYRMSGSMGFKHTDEECLNRSIRMSGKGNHQHGREYTHEERAAHSEIMSRSAVRGPDHVRYGISWSEEEREKRKQWSKEAYANRPNKVCPHCDVAMKPNLFARYHGDKCKDKK